MINNNYVIKDYTDEQEFDDYNLVSIYREGRVLFEIMYPEDCPDEDGNDTVKYVDINCKQGVCSGYNINDICLYNADGRGYTTVFLKAYFEDDDPLAAIESNNASLFSLLNGSGIVIKTDNSQIIVAVKDYDGKGTHCRIEIDGEGSYSFDPMMPSLDELAYDCDIYEAYEYGDRFGQKLIEVIRKCAVSSKQTHEFIARGIEHGMIRSLN